MSDVMGNINRDVVDNELEEETKTEETTPK